MLAASMLDPELANSPKAGGAEARTISVESERSELVKPAAGSFPSRKGADAVFVQSISVIVTGSWCAT